MYSCRGLSKIVYGCDRERASGSLQLRRFSFHRRPSGSVFVSYVEIFHSRSGDTPVRRRPFNVNQFFP